MMKDSHVRSISKAVSWRLLGTVATMLIVFIATHKIRLSIGIGLLEFFSKIGLFYFHERLWEMLKFSRVRNDQ